MKKNLYKGMIIFCSFLAILSSAEATSLKHTINKTNKNLNYGIKVYDLTNHKVLYQHNANHYFTPASNDKLYTTAAALLYFGQAYRFNTDLYSNNNQIKNGVLTGNIYLKFSGDPSLTSADIKALFRKLKIMGIKKIQGDFILDATDYTASQYGPGWMLDDVQYGYGAPLSAMIINENAIDLNINPAAKIGEKAWVQLISQPSVKINNGLLTVKNQQYCQVNYTMNQNNQLTVTGCIKQISHGYEQTIAVKNIKTYVITNLKSALSSNGITLHGQFKMGKVPKKALLLAEHQSAPLSQLVRHTLKESDNVYAESIFLKLGELYFNQPATWHNAQKAVAKVLKEYLKITMLKSNSVDGSGLSRYNLTTPANLVLLLRRMYGYFPDSYDFIASLPMAGVDGTLNKRMLSHSMVETVRAKTGSMSGVSTLSGYLVTTKKHVLAFSIMMNGFTGRLKTYRHLQDRLLKVLRGLNLHQAQQASAHFSSISSVENKKMVLADLALNRQELKLRSELANSNITLLRYGNNLVLKVPTNMNLNRLNTRFKSELSGVQVLFKN